MKSTITLLLIIALTACGGWRLRGSDNTHLQVDSIFLSGEFGATYSLVREQLQQKNALSASPAAGLQLILYDETIRRRTASVNRDGVTAEYELILTIDYQINDAANTVVRPITSVHIVRSYNFDQDDVVGKDKEELLLRKEMQRAAAHQLLRQLQLLQRN